MKHDSAFLSPHRALDDAVDGAPGDAEELGDLRAGVPAAAVQGHEVFFLGGGELGLLAAQAALGLGDLHALPGPRADEVGLEFGDHRQDVEQQPADRVGGVVDVSAQAELDVPFGEVLDDVAGVGQGPGQAVELGDHQGVPGPARGQGLFESGAFAVASGEPVVDIDQILGHAECLESCLLGGEVLLVGGDAGVPDQMRRHVLSVAFGLPSPGISAGGVCANPANTKVQPFHGSDSWTPGLAVGDRHKVPIQQATAFKYPSREVWAG